MSESHTLRMVIDAAGAQAGAQQFETAIKRIGTAVTSMDKEQSKAFSSMQRNVSGLDFSKVSRDIGKLGTVKVDNALAASLHKLSEALGSIKAPSAAQSANLSAFGRALGHMKTPSFDPRAIAAMSQALAGFRAPAASQTTGITAFVRALNGLHTNNYDPRKITAMLDSLSKFRAPNAAGAAGLTAFGTALSGMRTPSADSSKITALLQAVSGFRAPNASQIANFQRFSTSLGSISVTANIQKIIADLHLLTQAANNASSAMSRIQPVNIRSPGPRNQPPAAAGYNQAPRPLRGNQGYGPRTGTGGYEGLLSGQHRATGELRGLENLVNPTFQAASVLRTMLGTLTMGHFISEIYEAGVAMTQFQHVLEVTSKSEQETGERMQFVTDTSRRLGMNLQVMRTGYGQMSTAIIEAGHTTADADRVFTNVATTLRAVGASSTHSEQALRAVIQAYSNGTISQNQMHRELVNIPGMYESAARTWSRLHGGAGELGAPAVDPKDQQKMSQKFTQDIRDKKVAGNFMDAAFSVRAYETRGGLPTAVASAQSAMERLRTEWTLTKEMMGKSGLMDGIARELDRVTKLLQRADIQAMFKRLALGIESAIHMAGDALQYLAGHLDVVLPMLKGAAFLGTIAALGYVGSAFSNLGTMIKVTLLGPLSAAVGMMGRISVLAPAMVGTAAARGAPNFIQGVAPMGAAAAAAGMAGRGPVSPVPQMSRGVGGLTPGAFGASALVGGIVGNQLADGAGTGTQIAATVGGAVAAPIVLRGLATAIPAITTGLAGIGAAALTAMGVLAAGAGVAAGAIFVARDNTIDLSNGTITVGEVWARVGASIMGHTGKVSGSLTSGFGSAIDWIIGKFKELGVFFTRMAAGFVATMSNIGDTIQRYASMKIEMTGPLSLIPKVTMDPAKPHVNAQMVMQAYAADQKAEQAAAAARAESVRIGGGGTSATGRRGAPPMVQPTRAQFSGYDAPGKEKKAGGGHKKDPAEKAKSDYEALQRSLDGEEGYMARYQKMLKTLDEALKYHIIDQGQAAATEKLFATKMLETLGAVNPVIKAMKEMNDVRGMLNALNKHGAITTQQMNTALGETARKLNEAINPYDTWLKKVREETAELYANSYERKKAIDMRKLEEEIMKKQGGQELTPEQKLQAGDAIDKLEAAKEHKKDAGAGLGGMADGMKDLYTELAKLEAKVVSGAEDAFKQFIKTGHMDFKGLLDKITGDLADVAFTQMKQFALQQFGLIDDKGHSATNGGSLIGDLLGMDNPRKNADDAAKKSLELIDAKIKADIVNLTAGNLQAPGNGGAGTTAGAINGNNATGPNGGTTAGVGLTPNGGQTPATTATTDDNPFGGAGQARGGPMPDPSREAIANSAAINSAASGQGGAGALVAGLGSMGTAIAAAGSRSGGAAGSALSAGGSLLSGLMKDGAFSKTGLFGSQGSLFGASGMFGSMGGLAKLFGNGGGSTSVGGYTNGGMPLDGSDPFAGAGAGSSAFSGGAGGVDAAAGGVDAFGGAGVDLASVVPAFSEGGYATNPVSSGSMSAASWASAPHYAEGTVNTAGGIPSILHPNEAVIPLSRGRSIPVEMKGGGTGGATTTHIWNITTPDANSFKESQGQLESRVTGSMLRARSRNGG